MTLRATVVAMLVALCVVVAACGDEAAKTDDAPLPTGTARPPAPPAASLAACSTDDTEATASYQGATGSMAGGITVTNTSDVPCRLQGSPNVRLTDGAGDDLAVAQLASDPGGEVEAIALLPLERAGAFFLWGNWCPPGVQEASSGEEIPGGVVFVVDLPEDGGQVTVPATNPAGSGPQGQVPSCGAPGVDSTISVGAFALP